MTRRTSAWVSTHAPTGTRWGKRTLALPLNLALCLTLLPGAALAAEVGTDSAAPGKAIQLGTGSITGYADTNSYDYIYFGSWENTDSKAASGPIKWRVLDTKTNMDEATEGNGLFLLSDASPGTGDGGGVSFDKTNSNIWQGSDAQS